MQEVHSVSGKSSRMCLSANLLVAPTFTFLLQSCILCPNEGGAFKQTVQGEWVHLLCAIWVPETRVANEVFMEPVTGVDRISKQRWKLVSIRAITHVFLIPSAVLSQKCDVCGVREGACIQCNKQSCFLAFHATCARKERLLMPMKASQGSEAPTLACYCEKHLPVCSHCFFRTMTDL